VLEKKTTSSSSPKMVKSTYRSMPPDMEGSLQKIPRSNPQNLWLRRNHHHSCDRAVSSHALKRDNYLGGPEPNKRALKAEGFLQRAEPWSEIQSSVASVKMEGAQVKEGRDGFKELRQDPGWQLARI